jgi:hypothetical protein
MTEIIFLVEEAPEGGYTARALGHAIFAEDDTIEELRASVRGAVKSHFNEGERPHLIRLHRVLAVEELIREIEAAFEKVALGSGVSLQVANALDDYATEAELNALRQRDVERRWQDIPDEEIEQFHDTLAFMDAEGFRFHIPRFMLYALGSCQTRQSGDASHHSSDPGIVDDVIYALDLSGQAPDLHEHTLDKFRLFSGRQRMAIAHFLAFFSGAENDADSTTASHALAQLWSVYLEAGE